MRLRSARLLTLVLTAVVAFSTVLPAAVGSGAVVDVRTYTPVMGPSLLTAKQLAAWYSRHSRVTPQIPTFSGHRAHDVAALAQVFIDDGKAEGVRGDIAFVQSMLETGWLGFQDSQIPPDAFNYAGIYAFDGRPALSSCAHGDATPSRCMGTPRHGVLMQIQLLRSYADPTTRRLKHRLIAAPSDRVGAAPAWEYFGGHNCPCGKLIWASANGYGMQIIRMYSQAVAESGVTGACVPYTRPVTGIASGTGYWEVTSTGVVDPIGAAHDYKHSPAARLVAPIVGAASLSNATGYWLVDTHGNIYKYGTARYFGSAASVHLNAPVTGMARARNDNGYWLVGSDGGVFGYGGAHYYGSASNLHLAQPVLGIEGTPTGYGYWLFASDGGVFGYGDAHFYGSLSATRLSSPVVAMQRTASGHGYWMMTADGHIFSFGDARNHGDISGCTSYHGATALLATPDGNGYWITTRTGAVIPFGSAANLGFARTIRGEPVVLLSADPSSFTYTAHYTDAQYALLVKTATYFHLAVRDVPKTGVAALAANITRSPHPKNKPIGAVHNSGPHTISTTYDAATNAITIIPVEKHLDTTGDNVLYVGGLLMEYFAAIHGVR